MSKRSNEGQQEAHTGGDPAPATADRRDQVLRDGGDQMALDALLTGSPDVAATDILGAAAELVARERRARGRPPGSPNRKNDEMVRYLQSLGHRDPWVTLSAIQTADTLALAARLGTVVRDKDGSIARDRDGFPLVEGCSPIEVLRIQQAAARDLMPFSYARKSVEPGDEPPQQRPVINIGEFNMTRVEQQLTMSAGVAPDQRNQGLSVDAQPCDDDGASHG